MNAQGVASALRRTAAKGRAVGRARRARSAIRPGERLPGVYEAGLVAEPLRLVPAPVFLLSSIRSGSTLLRAVLNSHSQIYAPHELHLKLVRVELEHPNAEAGMKEVGMNARGLENLLWDRVLHLQLLRSGKPIIVDKTPQNVLDWRRLLAAWPRARYIVLLRHPVRVFESIRRAWPEDDEQGHYELTTRYARELAAAAKRLPNITVRYEDFATDPEQGSRDLCAYLGVAWEASMLRYAEQEHGGFRGRLGDWSDAIRSGVIRPPGPPPERIPPKLEQACRLLGY